MQLSCTARVMIAWHGLCVDTVCCRYSSFCICLSVNLFQMSSACPLQQFLLWLFIIVNTDPAGFLICSHCCLFLSCAFFVLTVKALANRHASISITAMPTTPQGLDTFGPPWIHHVCLSIHLSMLPSFLPSLQHLQPPYHVWLFAVEDIATSVQADGQERMLLMFLLHKYFLQYTVEHTVYTAFETQLERYA